MTQAQQPEALIAEYRKTMPPDVLHLWAQDACAELRRLHARVQELEARLEIDSRHSVDGIEARDCTIKLQDERIAELEAQLAAQRVPLTWPKDAKEVREFFHADFISMAFAREDQEPDDGDKYLITAHDFLSAINWWADFPHVPRAHGIGEQPCT